MPKPPRSKRPSRPQPEQPRQDRDPVTARFLPGNRIWERSYGGLPKFKTAEDLWEAAKDYFRWVEENPLWEDKVYVSGGVPVHEPLRKLRAMTHEGLCLFLNVSRTQWHNWKTGKERPDLLHVVAAVDDVIREQKFTGAAADLFNAGLIARDLGLADRSEHTGKDGGPLQHEHSLPHETVAALDDIAAQLSKLPRSTGQD